MLSKYLSRGIGRVPVKKIKNHLNANEAELHLAGIPDLISEFRYDIGVSGISQRGIFKYFGKA